MRTPHPSDRYQTPGDHPVDSSVVCVITRFGVKGLLALLRTYLDYRRIAAEAHQAGVSGLIRSAFLLEGPRTCYVVSLWSSYSAIPYFGTRAPSHVTAARSAFGRFRRAAKGGPELWSTKWRLTSVSNNLSWSDFDLRDWLDGSRASAVQPTGASASHRAFNK